MVPLAVSQLTTEQPELFGQMFYLALFKSGKTALVTPCPIQIANGLRSLVLPWSGAPEPAKLREAVPSKPTVADRPADRPLQPGNLQSFLLPTAQADALTPLDQQRSADRQQGPVQLSLIRVCMFLRANSARPTSGIG